MATFFGPERSHEDGDPLAHGVVHDFERLAQAGPLPLGQRDLVVGTLVDEAVTPPHRAADLDDLAGAGQRSVVRDPVEALDDLRARGAQPQDEAAPGQLVEADGRHRHERRGARVEGQDARADLRLPGHRGQEPHGGDGVGRVGLARPEVVDAHVLQPFGVRGELVRVVPHPYRRAQLHGPAPPATVGAPLAHSDNRGYYLIMSIAITEDHRALGQTASDFLAKRDARGAARALLLEETETLPGLLGRPGVPGLAGPAPARGAGRLGVRPARARRRGRGARPRRGAGTLRAHRHRQRRHQRRRFRRGGLAVRAGPGRRIRLRRHRADVRHHGVGRQGHRDGEGGPGWWPRPDPRPSRRRRRHCGRDIGWRRDRRSAGQPRSHPAHRPGDARRRVGARHHRRAPDPGRSGPAHHCGRGGRHRHRVHRAGRRLRQGARAVRPAHRHVPGRQAPLRQHVGGLRARHGDGVGRRPRRGGRRCAAVARRGHGGGARAVGRRRVRPAQHSGARRHRLHLGARRPSVSPPGHRPRGGRGRGGGGAGHHRPGAGRHTARAHHRPAAGSRAHARRGAGLRRSGEGPRRRGAAGSDDRDRLRHAALAHAVGPRRRCGRAARH